MSKHIRILWLLTIILVLSCQNGNIVPIFDAEKELGIWVDLWNTYDLTQVENIFITDNTVTYFSSEKEGLVKGFDAVVEHHRGFGFVEGGKETGNKLWLEDLNTQVHDSSVTVSGIW
ncbi:MAG: hypothetical protein GY863_20920, partial [bacterium]|nr:hypothetical protein [bacterium]